VNRFLIRFTNTAGKVTITAKADGLKSAEVFLYTQPFKTENGLSKILPAAGLPSVLKRGPTPATPSYTMLRKPVAIVNATAGAHADSAYASYDDNELSEWVNDGKLTTAWVEYDLEREATVSEITLKLNNFRSRIYPLIITLDGKEIFNGNTQTSLGYHTIKCNPLKGKKLRIQLSGVSQNKNTDAGVEVNGKKLDDGVARNDANAKGTLSIIEVELYEKL
jgi:hypothetical protein